MRAPLRPPGASWATPGPSLARHGRAPWRASDIVVVAIAATLIGTLLVHIIARLILASGAGQAIQQAIQHATGL